MFVKKKNIQCSIYVYLYVLPKMQSVVDTEATTPLKIPKEKMIATVEALISSSSDTN